MKMLCHVTRLRLGVSQPILIEWCYML